MKFEFGVLAEFIEIDAKDWTIRPLQDFNKTIAEWNNLGIDRDWVYPPMQCTVRIGAGPDGLTESKVPNSERQAYYWQIPGTDELIYKGRRELKKDQEDMATFVIYLIGLMYGVQLQHSTRGWLVTGKQRKRASPIFYFSPDTAAWVINSAGRWFLKRPRAVRTAITGALYLHNHVPAYERDWERFAWQYASFDAAW